MGGTDFSNTKTLKYVDSMFYGLLTHHHLLSVLAIIIILLLIVSPFVLRSLRIIKPNKDLKQYKEEADKLHEDSQQKSYILTLMDQVNQEIPNLNSLLGSEKRDYGMNLISMVMSQIPQLFKSSKRESHRCAIFIPDPEDANQLKILEGNGYSMRGKEKLRLKIYEEGSLAGNVYLRKEYKYTPDVTKDTNFVPNPKATKKYFSLLCVPIMVRDEIIGVLSIDGSEPDCFSKGDIQYFTIFSNLIGILMDIADVQLRRGDDENEVQDAG
ncbi:GAF domain-containing protein [Pullulanibacillus sp. KACC 23026]|uniref:GAF domain-containing protein n=1 Tax=Pullulanibacillus sp. KACC 23026 TaxID=3028315 RepID=UPI0023AE7B5C|nr:GAF domain-containing protein [Pullulanibacillus sp. KACC 23026]WEG14173.1 GAF domain-containing protein [Pullulanibacillus sp. KACC 23026]